MLLLLCKIVGGEDEKWGSFLLLECLNDGVCNGGDFFVLLFLLLLLVVVIFLFNELSVLDFFVFLL